MRYRPRRDGVVYAEVRYAPELNVEAGLSLDEVVAATIDGFQRAEQETGIVIKVILCAMRTAAHSLDIAHLAVKWRDAGVVGFDIAGAEAGHPPSRHLDAFQYVMRENFHSTIHAGEAFGLPSIWEALQYCGAARLGHGVRIVDDITKTDADGNSAASPSSFETAEFPSNFVPRQMSTRVSALTSPRTQSASCEICDSE